jgi:hypothetical protein
MQKAKPSNLVAILATINSFVYMANAMFEIAIQNKKYYFSSFLFKLQLRFETR